MELNTGIESSQSGSDTKETSCELCAKCNIAKKSVLKANEELFEITNELEKLLNTKQPRISNKKLQIFLDEMLSLTINFKASSFNLRIALIDYPIK